MKNLQLFFLATYCIGASFGQCTEKRAPILRNFATATLNEINRLRNNPQQYAQDNNLSTQPCNDGSVESATLLQPGGRLSSSVEALSLDERLNRAATDYAEYLATNNLFGHNFLGTPSARCTHTKYGTCGENIAAGSWTTHNAEQNPESAAQAFVLQLTRDCNVSSRGHLENMLNPSYKVLGVGFFRHSKSSYQNYTVHNFGTRK